MQRRQWKDHTCRCFILINSKFQETKCCRTSLSTYWFTLNINITCSLIYYLDILKFRGYIITGKLLTWVKCFLFLFIIYILSPNNGLRAKFYWESMGLFCAILLGMFCAWINFWIELNKLIINVLHFIDHRIQTTIIIVQLKKQIVTTRH